MRTLSPRFRYLARATVQSLAQLHRDLAYRFDRARSGGMPPMPPPYLRYRVAGHYRIDDFHESGIASRQAFEKALAGIDRRLSDFDRILDFGVGCSRIMRFMEDVGVGADLHGTDVDPPAIRWSRKAIAFATFALNASRPPLDYADRSFDLVYSNSVFTHLDDAYQDEWLAELSRITRPGGILLLTVNSTMPWRDFTKSFAQHPRIDEFIARYDEDGFCFIEDDEWGGVFPDFYHSMFHRRDYIEDHWSRFFDVLDYGECAMLDYQDIVTLQKR